ncbi:MAG: histidine--tRNA ligase [Endomicrobiales bacterium]|nr:histidine--tRNA ligase [Endomicrobiales bacterium]
MKFKAPRGTHDIWGKDAEKLARLEDFARTIFRKYGYGEMRVPVFEDAALFSRSIGESTDIVEKEMYVFEDRKGRKLALRPEGTASVVRAYLENGLSQALPVPKLFYMGPMFRYERPQAGRYREFFQIGAEYFANPDPTADAETILLAREIVGSAGVTDAVVNVNSLGCGKCRPAYRAELKKYFSDKKGLCADCQKRLEKNPLRLLDCKIDSQKFSDFPKMSGYLCDECRGHFDKTRKLLYSAGCEFVVDDRLVRGLDYYTRTIFEVRSNALGSQDAVAAGGRYDNLVKELGGEHTPSVGFALGSERVILAARNAETVFESGAPATRVFVAVAGQGLEEAAFKLVSQLRKDGPESDRVKKILTLSVRTVAEGPFASKSLKSQMRLADKFNADKTVILGEEEMKRGVIVVRDMKSQEQVEIKAEEVTGR